jgi:PAS domain S-box-containing protein
MNEENKNTLHPGTNTSFPDPKQIREQAEQKAKSLPLPNLAHITREEIELMVHELHVKQLAADLQIEQLRNQLEKRDEQAVLFRIVTENMLDMLALTDMKGDILFAGKSHEILGYELVDLIGKNVMGFVHPEDLPHILEEFAEFVAMDHPRRVEYRYRCKDGSYLWLETWGNFITDENGIPEKIVFSSRDITERKQAEEKVSDLNQFFSSTIDGLYHRAQTGGRSSEGK